jgi:hypothetical protein
MQKSYVAVLVAALLSIPTLCFAETYLCVAEKSVGFQLKSGWENANFDVTKTKMIFRSVMSDEKDALGKIIRSPYVAYEFDSDFLDAEVNGCSSNRAGTLYFCDIWGTEYIFNKQHRIFQSVDKLGYVLQNDKNFKSDVAITIGKCSKIG